MIEITNEDNMELMARYPDNHFDLAIVDPPYGIDADKKNSTNKKQSKKSASKSKDYGNQDWDSAIPEQDYFDEVCRVSKKQIIWGANYFGLSGGMIYWHKNVTMPTYSSGELAYKSWERKIDFIEITWHGMLQHDMKNKEVRIHPTQKPVMLYEKLIMDYCKPNQKILDTHLGSGSIALAVHNCNEREQMNLSLTACELDKEYYESALKRLENHTKQTTIFSI